MANIWAFDCGARHSTAQIQAAKGLTQVAGTNLPTVQANAGRGGNTPVIRLSSQSTPGSMLKVFSYSAVTEAYFFFRLKAQNAVTGSATSSLFEVQNGAGGIVARLRYGSGSGTADLYLESSSVQTGALTLSLAVQQVIEVRVKIGSAGTGVLEMKVDGNTIYSNTAATFTTGGMQRVFFGAPNFGSAVNNVEIQDIEIHTPDGDQPTSWLGPAFFLHTDFPTGDGAVLQFTPDSANHYADVDDATADSGTTKLRSTATGNRDLFTFPALPTTVATVVGVVLCPVAQPVGAGGAPYLGNAVRIGSTVYTPGVARLVPSTWDENQLPCVALDPSTNATWASIAAVNSAQFGLEHRVA